MLAGVLRALKPGGRFVAEFGGHGNIAAIQVAIRACSRRMDGTPTCPPLLSRARQNTQTPRAHGFAVEEIDLIPRPTPLPTGIRGWLRDVRTRDARPHPRRHSASCSFEEVEDAAEAPKSAIRVRQLDRALRPPPLPRALYALVTFHFLLFTFTLLPLPPYRLSTHPLDNITHSLVGVALADARDRATGDEAAQRPLFVGAGIIAANLPDLDLVVFGHDSAAAGLSAAPSRPHAHRCRASAVLAWRLCYWPTAFFPSVRKMRAVRTVAVLAADCARAGEPSRARLAEQLWHPPVLSRSTTTGISVTPCSSWSRRCGLMLGVAVAWNAPASWHRMSPSRCRCWSFFPLSRPWMRMSRSRRWLIAGDRRPRLRLEQRSRLSPCEPARRLAIVHAGHGGGRRDGRALRGQRAPHRAGAEARASRAGSSIVILTPNPTSPLCWSVIGIELREAAGEYVLWRGTLSLQPAMEAADDSCSSHRFAGVENEPDHRRWPPCAARRNASTFVAAAERLPKGTAGFAHGCASDVRQSSNGKRFSICDSPTASARTSRTCGSSELHCPRFVPGWAMPRAVPGRYVSHRLRRFSMQSRADLSADSPS